MPIGKLVTQADALLRDWLDQNAPKPGTRLPSERSLAASLGLQHYAVNRAMSRLIAEGRVERDGYKLSVAHPSRPADTRFTCHLVVARRSIHLPGYKRVAKDMGIRLVVSTWESTGEAVLILEHLDKAACDAVVFDPPYMSSSAQWTPTTNRLTKQGIPVIVVNQPTDLQSSVIQDTRHDILLAIDHLAALGHRQLGLITDALSSPLAADILSAWQGLCRDKGLGDSARRVHALGNTTLKDESAETARLLSGEWKDVTAAILSTGLDCNIQQFLDQLGQAGRHVPRDLSLVFVGGAKSPSVSIPPVSSVATDMALIQETALHLAQRAARKIKAHGVQPAPACLRVQSQLHIRDSSRPPPSGNATASSQTPAQHTECSPAPADKGRDLEALLKTPYSLAAKASLSERARFHPLDISRQVNRPLNFRRGWLGDLPLKHFPPGIHDIHGVPFNILGGSRRSDCGAIVFRSAVNSTGSSSPLPDRIMIPVGHKAEAIYILHGCGYAKFMHAFARYRFRNGKTLLGDIPLVSQGQAPHDPASVPAGSAGLMPNIQDWWPDFTHTDFPNARMAPIQESDEGGHLPRHVYLYTLEWINPRPEKTVESLEISVDASLSTTLGVLAVTAVKP